MPGTKSTSTAKELLRRRLTMDIEKSSTNPEINIVLDRGLYSAINQMAENEGTSISLVMRDLIREALSLREDFGLALIAEEREHTFDPDKAVSHDEIWD